MPQDFNFIMRACKFVFLESSTTDCSHIVTKLVLNSCNIISLLIYSRMNYDSYSLFKSYVFLLILFHSLLFTLPQCRSYAPRNL